MSKVDVWKCRYGKIRGLELIRLGVRSITQFYVQGHLRFDKKKTKAKKQAMRPCSAVYITRRNFNNNRISRIYYFEKKWRCFFKKTCDSLINFFFDIKFWNLPIVLIGFIHWNDFAKIEHNSFSWRFRFGQSKRSFCLFRLQVQKPASNKYIKLTWLLLGLPHQI